MALKPVKLDDKFDLSKSRIFLTGTQAIVRLTLMQRHRDENKREDRGAHTYTLEEYGLTAQGVRRRFAQYCQTFFPDLVED